MPYRRILRWAAWLLLMSILAWTLSPLRLRPVTLAPAHLERFAAFAVIGVLFSLAYPLHRLRVLGFLVGVVVVLEFAQTYLPDRHGRPPDAMVKVAGALAGGALTTFVARRRKSP